MKESVGAFLFRWIDKPKWAEEKLRYWPLVGVVVGITLLFGRGLDLPVKTKTELPFLEWEKPKAAEVAQPVNIRAIIVGGVLIVLGLLGSVPMIPVTDKEKDERWPLDAGDQNSIIPVLFIDGPLSPDRDQIGQMLRKFGREWPGVTVRWPRSTNRILEAAAAFQASGHKLAPENAELIGIYKGFAQQVSDAKQMQQRFTDAIPGMIRRCQIIPDERLLGVVARYLTLANYRAWRRVYDSLAIAKKTFAEIDLPKSWDVLATHNAALQALYDVSHPSELRRGILIAIGDQPVYSEQGQGVQVTGRKGFMYHRTDSSFESGASLIAGLEVEVAQYGGTLPAAYEGQMLFSKIGPAGTWMPGSDQDVAIDAELETLSAEYTRRWQQAHPEQQRMA